LLLRGYIRLASPWLISSIPAFAYLLAYLNRFGEAYAHDVPSDWISVSLTDALSRTAAVALVTLLMMLLSGKGERWTQRFPLWSRRGLSRLLEQLGPAILYAFLLGLGLLAALFVVSSVVLTLVTLAWDYRRRDSLTEPPAAVRAGMVVLDPATRSDVADAQVSVILVAGFVVISLLVALLGGWSRAALQRQYLTVDNGSRVVAATYGNAVVLADVEIRPDGRWQVGRQRQLLPLPSASITFTVESAPVGVSW